MRFDICEYHSSLVSVKCEVHSIQICSCGVNKLGCRFLTVYAGFRLNTNKKLMPKVNACTDTVTHFISQVPMKCGVSLLFASFSAVMIFL